MKIKTKRYLLASLCLLMFVMGGIVVIMIIGSSSHPLLLGALGGLWMSAWLVASDYALNPPTYSTQNRGDGMHHR